MTARRRRAPAWAMVAAVVAAVAAAASGLGQAPAASAADQRLTQLIGQKLVITMNGTAPSQALLGRVRRGEVGGVVLLGSNISSPAQLRSLTHQLHAAAVAGGQPHFLIAVDQEGGSIKRVTWAPPTRTVPEMGNLNSTSVARNQGSRTGSALADLGINVDLAPVADIPRSTDSFMYQQGRTFSFDPDVTTRLADAFASGIGDGGIAATMKHFPGIGLARRNTDLYADTITASRGTLAEDLRPYRRAIGHDIPLIMLSNVTYTAYDANNAAGWSGAIVQTLLRGQLGFTGVTITDALNGAATSRGTTSRALAVRAAVAGTDMLLLVGSESSTAKLFDALVTKAGNGTIPRATLRASYRRILALKATLP